MHKRYYVKKGASFKERLRCPLCGKLSPIGYFSQNHVFGVYRQWFCGRGCIRWEFADKDASFMQILKESIVERLLDLLRHFTGQKYYSQSEIDDVVEQYERKLAEKTLVFVPTTKPSMKCTIKTNVKPYKVVVE